MRYARGGKEINVSKGAYNSIYKGMGFLPVDTVNEETETDMIEVTNGETTLLLQKTEYEKSYKGIGFLPMEEYRATINGLPDEKSQDTLLRDLSTSKLKVMARDKGVAGYSQMSKDELIVVLSSGKPKDQGCV